MEQETVRGYKAFNPDWTCRGFQYEVGKIANAYGLKTEEYGVFVMDKSRYSSKEVTSFRYNEKGKQRIREILEEG